ncbi:hypothetical protein HAX54_036530 [Datura stramonium]|uniref:Uncharacterized protein n=1 Tax=Datura stramonium TaxID=4076 RepID=A0ABS8SGE7_DATST|nr:hypothetical protein [Datura stramonium]
MALSSSTCFYHSQFSLKTDRWAPALTSDIPSNIRRNQPASSALKTLTPDHLSEQVQKQGTKHSSCWSFRGGSRVILQPNLQILPQRKSCRVSAMWLPSSQIASSAFTLGTAAVLPFYTLMVAAPKAEFVYHDGLQNGIETRHSVSLCLLFCPIGIVIHLLTKAVLLCSAEKTAPTTH